MTERTPCPSRNPNPDLGHRSIDGLAQSASGNLAGACLMLLKLPGGNAMQSIALIGIYISTAVVLQFLGFLISRVVDHQSPAASTLTFLILFLTAFGVAWPIAVRITEWLIARSGYVVHTEQSGGLGRTDHLRPRR
jgi:hypothetical protein